MSKVTKASKASVEPNLCLNLLDQCTRALGEMQMLAPIQPVLLKCSRNVPLSGLMPQVTCLEPITQPERVPPSGYITYTAQEMEVIKATNVDLISCYEFFGCDTLKDGPSNIGTICTWKMFVDSNLYPTHVFALSMSDPQLENIKISEKEIWYWVLKTRNRAQVLVPGILDSAKKMNCKKWLLPNGVEVDFNDVKATTLEVLPKHLYLGQSRRFIQTGGMVTTPENGVHMVIPYVKMDEEFFKSQPFLALFHRRLLPEGMTKTHYVIEAKLPSGGTYIVDPTSIQYNYRGPHGSLIAYGTWEEYEKGFPGKIIQRITKAQYPGSTRQIPFHGMPAKTFVLHTDIDEMYYMGEGPTKFITRLTENLVTYKDRRFCGYCGWIEGSHPVVSLTSVGLRYNFKTVTLLSCALCKKTEYCDKMCQKAHWKAHKKQCGKE